jgi:hypothetical protein
MSAMKSSAIKSSLIKSLLLGATLLGSLFGFDHVAFAQAVNAELVNVVQPPPPRALTEPAQQAAVANAAPTVLGEPEQRVALVIGNSNYRNAPRLANPDNDARSMAQFLNSAGFEVVAATDLTQNDMIKVVQDFSARVAAHGPNTVALIYYAGHGVQLAGENYLVPVDAKITTPADLVNESVRLVDVMATLEAIPSRMRIVLLDACRNNPFPTINDAGRGLAIVDAPNGSIVGYSTAPGAEALDGDDGHSPYTSAFLHLAREPNLPIEQLFKRVRLDVAHSTDGAQMPWESSSLTSDFYFFGDTAVAATHPPAHGPVVQMASNLPTRSVQQAYDFVVSEDQVDYYQEFVRLFPTDPLCDRIRWLLANLMEAAAWHKAVLANSPLAYKAFYESHSNSAYAMAALKLQSQPKMLPLGRPAHLILPRHFTPGLPFNNKLEGELHPRFGKIISLPAHGNATPVVSAGNGGKIVTLPVKTVGKGLPAQQLKNDAVAHEFKNTTVGFKSNAPAHAILAAPTNKPRFHGDRHDDAIAKFKPAPMPINRAPANVFGRKPTGIGGNFAPHLAAMGGGMPMGGGHRGFMR